MKAHRRLSRAVRALALTGSLSAILAMPALAGAMPIDYYHPHGVPASVSRSAPYALPSGFKTDVQSTSSAGAPDESGARLDHRGTVAQAPFTLPSGFKTDAQTKAPDVTTVPASQPQVVVRQIANDTDHTLAIVLASTALGIALLGAGFVALRMTRIQRRLAS